MSEHPLYDAEMQRMDVLHAYVRAMKELGIFTHVAYDSAAHRVEAYGGDWLVYFYVNHLLFASDIETVAITWSARSRKGKHNRKLSRKIAAASEYSEHMLTELIRSMHTDLGLTGEGF
ncbi:hypothetical protein FGG65_gp30 [Corynebacterium phage phi673]|uniref:Uncharacterized protein n=1 Tax=Corynebacterium phage phi673 TaxID=2052821 RepID=A0A2H4PIT1_9CAUD|nr:hypothetical protein FGG65_gp30 [Corynebacterium phage phi673]ATW62892.1 hypothetical protein phi673_gp30 [Corynebacterium phage phi673]